MNSGITYHLGNIFDTTADALVIPVNCVGVCGAGLAKQWASRYKDGASEYKLACKHHSVLPGNCFDVMTADDRVHFLLATKDHWRYPSQVGWVRQGLVSLRKEMLRMQLNSVAVPALGCGVGRLRWPYVQKLIIEHLGHQPFGVHVYPPQEQQL